MNRPEKHSISSTSGTSRARAALLFIGNKFISGTVIAGAGISGTVISGTVISGTVISGTVISGTVISGTVIAGAMISTAPDALAQGKPVKAAPIKLYGQVDELLSACANAGVEISSTKLPAHIEKVRMGSPAFYGGLQDNDVILKGTLDNNRLKLTIRRGAALYGIELATQASSGTPAVALKTASPTADLATGTAATTLKSGAEKQKDPIWKKLQKYDIVMLIDESGSMGEAVDANGLSKWAWCAKQLTSFASQALQATGQKFTIVTFSSEYKVRTDCSPHDVEDTFTNNTPGGGTDLAAPLDHVLQDYQHHTKTNPLLVVVLTDGMPADPFAVEQSIVQATKRMTAPDQIKIVFFEIGNDADGAALLKMLDFGLMSEGARYDIVDSNSFHRLEEVGLKQALYDCFDENQANHKSIPSENLDGELESVRKQLQDARARSAKNPSTR